jgi:glycosyl hydrolase family 123/3-keto-disaccharide hydrolase
VRGARKRVAGVLVAVGAMVLLGLPGAARAAASAQVWTASAADRVFDTSTLPPEAPTSVDLFAARGEQEAAQLAVRSASGEALTGVTVTAGPLTGPGGTIPEENVLVRRAYDHPNVEVMEGDAQLPPGGGTSYYDALVENTPRDLPGGVTQPYHYAVRVPADQAPGVYTGTVTVGTGNAGTSTVDVTLTVYDVTLPPTNQSTFKMDNWFTSAGWDYRGTEAAIPTQYGVTMYDDNWWRVIENIAANHARHRNNVIHADFQALLIPDTTVGQDGTLQFGWATFDRFVQTFVDAGALQYIYTPHLLEPAENGTATVEILSAVDGKAQRVLATPDTPETNAYLDQVFAALKEHLDAKGWTDRFYMSALDEPRTAAHGAAASWLYTKYRAHFPDPMTNEAHLAVVPGLDDNLSTVTPVLGHYEENLAYYQDRRINGTELWLYNCIIPRGAQMNRFISYHLAKTRLTPWLTWKIDGAGYLHWGWNYWFGSDPTVPADTFDGAQTGDNWLVRPNKAAYDVYDSLRSETQLDGVEDVELLTQLAKTKPLAARAIANSLITDTVSYTRTGADVDQRHRTVLDELTNGEPDRRYPFTDTFDAGDGEWVRGRGAWSVASTGEYLQTDTAGWGFTSTPKARAYGDVTVSVDQKIVGVNPSGGDTNWSGFVIRGSNATDMDTGYLVALRNNGEVFVYRSGRELAKATAENYQPSTYTRFRVVASGSTITAYVGDDPEPVLTVTDDAYAAGQVALVTGGASVRFDNMTVTPG